MAVLTYMSEFTNMKRRPSVTMFLCYAVAVSMILMPRKQAIKVYKRS